MRIGPKTKPANSLSEAERSEVLQIANSTEFRDLSPKQIVPRLADMGQYVASESSMERILDRMAKELTAVQSVARARGSLKKNSLRGLAKFGRGTSRFCEAQ